MQRVYGYDDTILAAVEFGPLYGVPIYLLACITYQESKWWPKARGDNRRSWGSAQLRSPGERDEFQRRGFTDADDPYQAVEFLAQRVSEGAGPRAWARAWRLCA